MKFEGIALPRANKRLTEIYNQAIQIVQVGDIVADVGADHGYLSAMLAKSQKFDRVIATDISAPSLSKTTQLAQELNLQIETRVGDGLVVVPEATLACICGMGGHEIIKILQNSNSTQKFVLQPVQNVIELREYLLKNKYKIIYDFVMQDQGKFYYILTIDGKGKNKYSKAEKYFGKNNLPNYKLDFNEYLKNEQKKLSFLEKFDINFVARSQRTELRQKIKYYKLCKKYITR